MLKSNACDCDGGASRMHFHFGPPKTWESLTEPAIACLSFTSAFHAL